jgi:hypothetical protein
MAKFSEHIPAARTPEIDEKRLRFSFKYLDFSNTKFLPTECSQGYLCKLFKILQALSDWRVGDFVNQSNREHRHMIPFETSTEPNGFQLSDTEQMGYVEGWQFSVNPEVPYDRGRVHGALVEDTFYLVWFDEHHRLCVKP